MVFQFMVNLLIAVIWMFLQDSYLMSTFLFGFILGVVLLFVLRRFFEFYCYVRRGSCYINMMLLFLRDLIKANIDFVKVVIKPRLDKLPGMIAVDSNLETEIEIATLAALITLTPGTVSMDFSADGRTIFVHALDVDDRDEMVADIKGSFEKAIMEVTR